MTSVQSELSLWTRDVLPEVLPYCEAQGIALLPFSPLGRGFLTGRFSSFDDLPEDDFRRDLPRFQQEALRINLAIVAVFERSQIVRLQRRRRWRSPGFSHRVPTWSPSGGTKMPKYLVDNAGAADLQLSATDLAELDALPQPEGTRY